MFRHPSARALALIFVLTLPAAAWAQGAMTNGANHTGSISGVGEVDQWTFTANQGDALILTLGEVPRTPDPNFWPWLRVTGPTGATLVCGNCWGDVATRMAATAPLTGTYTVLVSSFTTAVGDYVLRLAKTPGAFVVPPGDHGGAMINGANHTGRIEVADLDMWTFTANQGDALIITLGEIPVGPGTPDPGFWPWLRVFDPLGDALVCGNCWGDVSTRMAATAPLTGTYTVVVAGYTDAVAGDYVLRLARAPATFEVPAGDQGGPLVSGSNQTGRIERADLDMWSFTANQGDALILTLAEIPVGPSTPDPGFWPWLRLIGPTGNTIVCGNCWGDLVTHMAATAPLSGTYTVVVAGYTGDVAGDYVLRLSKTPGTFDVPAGDQGGPVANGVVQTGRIDLGDIDIWTFAATQGATISVTLAEIPVGPGTPDPGFWPWIRLFGPTGATVVCGNCWDNLVARLTTTAPLTGTYTLVVASAAVALEGTGNYNLTVNGVNTIPPPTTNPDSYVTMVDAPLSVPAPGVLGNDNANGGGALNAQLIAPATHGTVTLGANGSVSYTPNPGYVGPDSFMYRAVSSAGPGNTVTVTITVARNTDDPLAPTDLYASSIVGNNVTLRFTPPAGGATPTSYVLEGGVLPGQVLASIDTGSTYPIFTVVAPTGSFYVRMHTMAGAAKSGASNEIRIHVNVPVAPSAPANLTGMANGSSIALAWRNTFGGGAPGGVVLDVSGSLTASLPLGLTDGFQFNGVPGGTYTLSLRATNAGGTSPASNAITMTFPSATCEGPPLPPSRFLAYRLFRTLFVLWDPAENGGAPTSFVLNASGAFIGSIATTGRALNGSVGPGTYQLSVAAVNACGASSATPAQTVVVP
ncbi:MAG TPA: Ig-like domain-containing protein [Vicinamibacterales bacterium]|nr:Ig-like domain-containing protein [Vicinamibacterales bacterium]